MTKHLIILTSFMLIGLFLLSQPLSAQLFPTIAKQEKSDPEAAKVLKKLQDKYSKYPGIEADYTLQIDNRETKETQTGKIAQKGNKFKVANNGNEIYCDGMTLWMYVKNNNEVQINDYEPEDDMMSPSKIMRIYESEDKFTYALTNEDANIYQIEFKPLDKDADYFKMKAVINKPKMEISSIKVFAKDGTIYTLEIKSIRNATFEDSHFKFNKAKYPGVRESDMR